MSAPIFFYGILTNEGVNLEVDANTLLWSILTGLVLIVGFFIMRHFNTQDHNLEKLEGKVDRMDSRIDNLEIGQAKIMIKLGID